MRLPALAIRNHRFTQVVVALVAGLGLLSFFTMPRTEDPVFDLPLANVVVVFPGADPEVIEALAVDPLEEAIDELDELETLETSIEDGVAVISAEMMSGTPSDEAYDAVLQKVNEIRDELPDEVRSVDVIQPSLSDVTVLQLALVSGEGRAGGVGLGVGALGRVAEDLEREIEAVAGVKAVDTWGYADPQVRVELDPERMRALSLSVDHVAAAVQWAGADIPGGFVVSGERRLNVRTSGDFDSLDDIARAVIPGVPGRILRVADVADVQWATEDEEHRARFQGRPAVFLSVIQRKGTNIFQVMDGVRPAVEAFEESLPDGVELHTVFDQSVSVSSRVNGFFSSLFQGIVLVGVVMFLFVGLRAALLVMVTIPLAITFALAGVEFVGYGLQQMSIVGLVIALGLLVDDAIVVVENIGRLRREGRGVLDAALEGAAEVAWPSATGTLTTVLAFVPMVAIQSGTGDYIRSLPVTVILALVASLLLSLTLTPLMARRVLAGRKAGGEDASVGSGIDPTNPVEEAGSGLRTGLLQGPLTRAARGPYRRLLASALSRPRRVLLAGAGALGLALALFPLVGVSLFPKAEKAQILVNVEAPGGADLEAVGRIVSDLEGVLARREDVVRFASNVGADNPQVYYNVQPRQPRTNIGQILVEMESYEATLGAVPELNSVFDRYPGAHISITEFENGPPVEAPIVVKVTGPELGILEALAGQIEDLLLAHPGARDVRNPLGVSRTDLQVAVDPDRLALVGLDPLTLDRTVRAGVTGLEVGRLRDAEGTESDVVMRFPFLGNAPSPRDLEWVTLQAPGGGSVPLSQVARVELVPGSGRIDHYDTRRVATVTAYPVGDTSPLEVTRDVTSELEGAEWPDGYEWFAGGAFEEQQEGFAGMIRALLVAVLGIFAVLVLQFRSFVQPVIIFASVPLAFVGAVLALLLTGYTFSFTAFIGITSLVGIVINNSIILVDYANRRVSAGDSVDEALRKAGEVRFQPIVLTTVTTVGGLLPLTLTGSTLWSPLGWTIIGGLLTSTVLTLVLVPALYRVVSGERAPIVVPRVSG